MATNNRNNNGATYTLDVATTHRLNNRFLMQVEHKTDIIQP